MTLRDLRDSIAGRTIEVAAACEVAIQTVRNWEKAQAVPRPQHVRRLADFYKLTIPQIQEVLRETQKRPDTNDD